MLSDFRMLRGRDALTEAERSDLLAYESGDFHSSSDT